MMLKDLRGRTGDVDISVVAVVDQYGRYKSTTEFSLLIDSDRPTRSNVAAASGRISFALK